MQTATRPALMVGTIGFNDAEEVFRKTSEHLGDRLRRVPDGETGPRLMWIGWQLPTLMQTPGLDQSPPAPDALVPVPNFRLAQGVAIEDVKLDFKYAEAARESYEVFARLKKEGVIAPAVRFQVSLPTPFAGAHMFSTHGHRDELLPAFTKAMGNAVKEITDNIPHDQLAIQWDFCLELGYWERPYVRFTDDEPADEAAQKRICAATAEMIDLVPEDVEVGVHLCYGDNQHEHIKEPEDTANLVSMMHGLTKASDRAINWFHLPVPRDRDDAAYFAPLAELKLPKETEVYLGLVHITDGEEGVARRIAAAKTAISDFGVATECGMGRRPKDHSLEELLQIHRVAGEIV